MILSTGGGVHGPGGVCSRGDAWSQGGVGVGVGGVCSGGGLLSGGQCLVWGVPSPRGCLVLGGLLLGGVCSQGGAWSQGEEGCLIPGSAWWTPPGDGYCCERYASYWNAFLFKIRSLTRCKFVLKVTSER